MGHFVAVPPDHCERAVREFRSFTEDLLALAERGDVLDIKPIVYQRLVLPA